MSQQTLLPDLETPLRAYEVIVTVPRDGDDDVLVPDSAPRGMNIEACFTAAQVQIAVTVKASSLAEAVMLACMQAGEYGKDPRASVHGRPVPAA
jgi:hypothetical protein